MGGMIYLCYTRTRTRTHTRRAFLSYSHRQEMVGLFEKGEQPSATVSQCTSGSPEWLLSLQGVWNETPSTCESPSAAGAVPTLSGPFPG